MSDVEIEYLTWREGGSGWLRPLFLSQMCPKKSTKKGRGRLSPESNRICVKKSGETMGNLWFTNH